MNFCWCTITTGKLAESINFYTEVIGLSLAHRFKAGSDTEIVFLIDAKGSEIELISHGDHSAVSEKKDISLGFEVDSLDDTLALVAAKGIPIKEGPISAPTVRFFFVSDPNGVTIQFVEKSKE